LLDRQGTNIMGITDPTQQTHLGILRVIGPPGPLAGSTNTHCLEHEPHLALRLQQSRTLCLKGPLRAFELVRRQRWAELGARLPVGPSCTFEASVKVMLDVGGER
jgi:hypothetical protein